MTAVRILRAEIVTLEKERKALEKADLSEAEEREARDAIKADLREWLKTRDYSCVLENDRFWLAKDDGTWIPVPEKALHMERPTLRSAVEKAILIDVLREDGRWFDRCSYSFRKLDSDVLNMLRINFCPPADGAPHWLFDMLVAGLAGEKSDNVEHIERLIVAKYLHPDNIMIPSLVMQDGGGTGKSLFVTRVLSTLFGRSAVADNLSVEEVCAKFNTRLEGKALWFVNETARGRYSLDDLKRKVGSASMWIEPKGVNAFEADMTAWVIMSGNGAGGAVLLSNNEVDRRWSIVKGKRPLKELVADHLAITPDDAHAWVVAEGQHILADAMEVGRWITSLIDRHGDVTSIVGHHGSDYAELAETQKSIEDRLFEAVFAKSAEDEPFQWIKRSTLYSMYVDFSKQAGRTAKQRGTLYTDLTDWAAKRDIDIVMGRRKVGRGSNAPKIDFIIAGDLAERSDTRVDRDADDDFITVDPGTGRKSWSVDIG